MKAKVKRIAILTIIAMCISIGIQAQPASAFNPTNITITPRPTNIACGEAGVVTVKITGTITFADQQAQKFEVRLVDEDTFADDIMGKATVTPDTDGKGPFIKGEKRTFTLTFEIRCDDCTLTGLESSGESEADLAVEIDQGRIEDSTNHYDTKAGKAVPVRCVEFKKVSLKVNVLKGVTISDDEIDNIVKEANRNLRKARLELDFDKTKNINRDVSDQGNNNDKIETEDKNGNGKLDPGEDTGIPGIPGTAGNGKLDHESKKLNKKCVEELNEKFEKGKGLKVVFTNEIWGEPNTYGLAWCCDPNNPICYLKVRPGTIKSKGNDFAHEVCHVFSLGPGHKIDDTTNADDKGHHWNPATKTGDKNNKMYPYNPVDHTGGDRGDELTEYQRDEINRGAKKRGTSKSRTGDPVITLLDTKHGSWTDDLEDVSQGHIDLYIGHLFAAGPTCDLEVRTGLSGLHPNGTNVNSKFEMFFNTDNDTGTGSAFGSFNGIDKILNITLQGEYPFIPPDGSINAELLDVSSGTTEPLTSGNVDRIVTVVDVYWPELPSTFDYSDSIQQSLPLPFLGSLADQVPIGLRATNVDTGEFDETSFLFDFNPPPGPFLDMLTLVGVPGDTVDLLGTNFSPLSTVTILIDDTKIKQTTTLSDGTFSTSFTIPSLSAGDYFITARDDTGLYDFSVLKIPSPPIGGTVISVNKLELLAPWIGLAAVIISTVAVTAVFVKRRKKQK